MRLPFDLIAVLLGLEALRKSYEIHLGALPTTQQMLAWGSAQNSSAEAAGALAAYCLVVWLANEALTRRTEWLTRFGSSPRGLPDSSGAPPRRHPLAMHALGEAGLQACSVALYLLILWHYRWPVKSSAWPEWLGLQGLPEPTLQMLRQSYFSGVLFDLGPFVLALMLGWVPKRRLAQGIRARVIPLKKWLAFEAQMSFLPLLAYATFSLLSDLHFAARNYLPDAVREGLDNPWIMLPLNVLLLALFICVLTPWLVVRFWRCRPLQNGELKDRLQALLARSGVKARAILDWGPRGAGTLNACVLGPWAPMRYVLIGPGLQEQLSLEECEAVVAHELGHARYGHLRLLIVLGIGVGSCVGLVWLLLAQASPMLQAAGCLVTALLFICVLFGSVLRACEHEADLASAELIGSPVPLANALEKVAVLAGDIREVDSWHHGTIASRVEHLYREGLDSERSALYHKRVRRMRVAFMLFAALMAVAVIGFGWQAN